MEEHKIKATVTKTVPTVICLTHGLLSYHKDSVVMINYLVCNINN